MVEVQRVGYGMYCPENYRYRIEVKWRATSPTGRRVMREATPRCVQTSSRAMEAWLADPGYARVEVKHVLAAIGRRMAAELLAAEPLDACSLQSNEAGEIERRNAPATPPTASEARH